MENVIEFKNVWKVFEKKDFFKSKKVEALRGVTFNVKKGEVFGFLGPNGAGKTTTLRVIMGFIRPTKGEVKVFGQPPLNMDIKKEIGYLPESPHPPGHLKGSEFLKAMALFSGLPKKDIRVKTRKCMRLFGLEEASGRRISSYSKGMIQKLSLASAFIHDPEFIILDEPTSGLDPEGRKFILDLTKELKKRGKTVLFSTHILSDIKGICDRIGLIVRGKLVKVFETEWFQRDFVLIEYRNFSSVPLKIDFDLIVPLSSPNGVSKVLIDSSFLGEFKKILKRGGREIVRVSSYLPDIDEILTSEIRTFKKGDV